MYKQGNFLEIYVLFLYSLDLKCAVTHSPADHYINTLAVSPGRETWSQERIKRISDSYAMSTYCTDIEVIIQRQNNLHPWSTGCGNDVCCIGKELFMYNFLHLCLCL